MHCRQTQSDSEIRIRRSVARLLSLADRVERSCFQFVLIRVFLLWLLRPAELRIRDNVFGLAEDFGFAELPSDFNVFEVSDSGGLAHNSVDEALDMALRLRALAGLMVWIYGLDLTGAHNNEALFRENYWRHMRCLADVLQVRAHTKLRAGQYCKRTFQRPEVRPALAGLP